MTMSTLAAATIAYTGYDRMDWQVDEYSRARAATGAGWNGAEQDGRANVAREMEGAMKQCEETARTGCRFQLSSAFSAMIIAGVFL